MNLIAYDGITTGRIEPRNNLGLGPGNRADVMIQAPLEPGTYVLLKRELGVGKNNTEVFPDILTKVVVEGARLDMVLPTERELAPLAPFASLADLPETAIDNHHTATFLFYPQPPQKEFLGMGFDGDSTRFDTSTMEHMFLNAIKLTLGDIDEWTLQIRDNGKTQSAHPFHIHVNPFQVTKLDGQSLEHPRWQDTILLTPGHTITFRTQYTVFEGMFVFHCHFLDHEDLGMMRLVDIVRSPSN